MAQIRAKALKAWQNVWPLDAHSIFREGRLIDVMRSVPEPQFFRAFSAGRSFCRHLGLADSA